MKKGLITLALIVLGINFGFSQGVNSVSDAQTLFIYNFSRLIQWPQTSKTGEFIIGVIGDNELYGKLNSYVVNKKVGNQSISVKKFDDPKLITGCHILFVGDGKINQLETMISKLQGSSTLIVTERKGMINSGSAIDLFMVDDKLKFVMNSDNAVKYNLTVSKSLQDMAYNN